MILRHQICIKYLYNQFIVWLCHHHHSLHWWSYAIVGMRCSRWGGLVYFSFLNCFVVSLWHSVAWNSMRRKPALWWIWSLRRRMLLWRGALESECWWIQWPGLERACRVRWNLILLQQSLSLRTSKRFAMELWGLVLVTFLLHSHRNRYFIFLGSATIHNGFFFLQ